MVKVTHLNFSDESRTLAVMRATMLRLSLTEHLTRLIVADAKQAGLLDYLDSPAECGAMETINERQLK